MEDAVDVVDGEKVQKVRIVYNFVGEMKVASISSAYKKVKLE